MAKLCNKCGTYVDEGDKFCQECGAALMGAAPEIVDAEIILPTRRSESPAADAREVRERLIGTKTEYYLPRFEKMEVLNSFTSWNWAAFLAGCSWMFYRKMYVFGAVMWVIARGISLLQNNALSLILWLGLGVVGNFLYMKDIDGRTDKAMNMQPEEREAYIQKNSGTSWIPVIISWVASALVTALFVT